MFDIDTEFYIYGKTWLMNSARILIVDDDRDVLETAKMFLKQEFTQVHIDENPNNIPNHLELESSTSSFWI